MSPLGENNNSNNNSNNNNDNNQTTSEEKEQRKHQIMLLSKKKKIRSSSISSRKGKSTNKEQQPRQYQQQQHQKQQQQYHQQQHQQQHQPQLEDERERPMQAYIPPYLQRLIIPYHGDFCQTPIFHPKLIIQLMAEGFLPIATRGALLPKLHKHRSVILLNTTINREVTTPTPTTTATPTTTTNLHISKSTRKKSSKFTLTINQAFRDVVKGCHDQHEQCWLYPPLVEAFAAIQQQEDMQQAVVMNDNTQSNNINSATKIRQSCRVRVYSIECWSAETGNLVAGELGYTVGSCYTSLTGFSNTSSAGSVQLAALGRLLLQQGFLLWDLGMDMDYKRQLGATLLPRWQFVQHIHSMRCNHTVALTMMMEPTKQRVNCKTVIDAGIPKISAPSQQSLSYTNNNNSSTLCNSSPSSPLSSPSRQKPKFRTNKRCPKKLKPGLQRSEAIDGDDIATATTTRPEDIPNL